MKSKDYNTILSRAKEDRPPEAMYLAVTADGDPYVALAWTGRQATFLDLSEARRVTGNVDAVQKDTVLVAVLKDRRAGASDPVIYRDAGAIRLITGMNVEHTDTGEVINAEYYAITPGYVNETQHNHQHLVRDPDREHEYFSFGPF